MCKGNKIKDGDEMTEGPVFIKEVLDLDKYHGLKVSGVPNRVWGEYNWMLSASFILVISSLLPSSPLWELATHVTVLWWRNLFILHRYNVETRI